MDIQVTKNKISLINKALVNENEYNVTTMNFIFTEEYSDNLVKVALFTANNITYKEIITQNSCNIPAEILSNEGVFTLGVYAYSTVDVYEITKDVEIDETKTYYTRTGSGTEENPYVYIEVENPVVDNLLTYYEKTVELSLRYSPSPLKLVIDTGSYIPDEQTENSKPITASELEQYQEALNAGLLEVENVNISADKVDNVATVTITNRYAEQTSVDIYDGDDYVITEQDYQEIAEVVENDIQSILDGKVDKVEGKGLSTNDFTNTYKEKLDNTTASFTTEKNNKLTGIQAGAEVNVLTDIKVNGTTQTKINKAVDITVPTKVSDLTNDSGYITSYTETDPTVPDYVKNITEQNITDWNNKSNFSGSYNDLTDKPTIPTKTSDLTNDSNFVNETELGTVETSLQAEINKLEGQILVNDSEKSSNVVMNDSLDGKINKIEIEGNSEQNQYQGYNLWRNNVEFPFTAYGVTVDYDETTGMYTLSGTSTDPGFLNIFTGAFDDFANGDKVSMTIKRISGTNSKQFHVGGYNTNDNTNSWVGHVTLSASQQSNSAVETLTRDGMTRAFLWVIEAGIEFTNFRFQVVLAKTTETNLEWEPYVGGKASPRPDWKQNVNNVTGDAEIDFSNSDNTQEQNFTFPLSQGQKMRKGDYLADDGIHHVRAEYTFTGNETFNKSSMSSSTAFVCYTSSITPTPKVNGTNGLINIGVAKGVNYIYTYPNGFFYNQNINHFLKIEVSAIPNWDDSLTDNEKIALFKNYLATQYNNNTPVILEYELETETVEAYTTEQQAVYNALKQAQTYKGITYIDTSSDGASPLVQVNYKQDSNIVKNDLTTRIENLEARVALLE